MTDPSISRAVPERLALALDVDDLERAVELSGKVGAYFSIAKIGLELFAAEGPDAVRALQASGFEVFLDLKLHDIPTTVGRASRVIARLGVRFVTVHAQGGAAMLEAAAEGLRDGAHDAGVRAPIGLGVTVLTSDPVPDPAVLTTRAALVRASGLGGLVCAAPDLTHVRSAAPGLVTVVPGTRPADSAVDDQARVTTPAEAIALGADVLVIGRAVTAAGDPTLAACEIARSVSAVLA